MACVYGGRVISPFWLFSARTVVEELYRSQVKHVPMFNGMQEEIVVRVCYVLRPLNCMGGDRHGLC